MSNPIEEWKDLHWFPKIVIGIGGLLFSMFIVFLVIFVPIYLLITSPFKTIVIFGTLVAIICIAAFLIFLMDSGERGIYY